MVRSVKLPAGMVIAMAEQLTPHVRVATLNTWGVAIRASQLASRYSVIGAEFEAGHADVVCFQEVFSYWHLWLLARRMRSFRHVSYRLAALGPDVLAAEFDYGRFLSRLREDDPGRPIGDALLDQRTVAGIGNIWKSEGCWEAGVSPWRPVGQVSDEEARLLVERVRPRMLRSGTHGPRFAGAQLYRRPGRPCPRCGTPIRSGPQGDGNRMTYWCPGCQR